MNAIVNSVQLLGNLGSDVEITELTNGSKLAKVSIATNKYYKNKEGERVQKTQWHSLVAWGKTAELMEQHLQKGTKVLIKGELNHDSYTNKEGKMVYVSNVKVSEFERISPKDEKLPF